MPQRGLVYQGEIDIEALSGKYLTGRPNLTLFNQLFWVILIPYCTIGIFMSPLLSIIRGSFHLNFHSKICLLRSVSDVDIVKVNIAPLITPVTATILCTYWRWKSKRYMDDMCPNKTMSSVGDYRRNFATFDETLKWIQVHLLELLLTKGLLFSMLQALECKPETNVLITNICYIFNSSIYHGIFIPTKMQIPKVEKGKTISSFFVRPPQSLEPREPVFRQNHVVTVSKPVKLNLTDSKWRRKKRKCERKARVKAEKGKMGKKNAKVNATGIDPIPTSVPPPLLIRVRPVDIRTNLGENLGDDFDGALEQPSEQAVSKEMKVGVENCVKLARAWMFKRPASGFSDAGGREISDKEDEKMFGTIRRGEGSKVFVNLKGADGVSYNKKPRRWTRKGGKTLCRRSTIIVDLSLGVFNIDIVYRFECF